MELRIPQSGDSVTEVEIAEWFKEDGASVVSGDLIYSYESDKSTVEVEAPISGVLEILVEKGESVKVGEVVAILN